MIRAATGISRSKEDHKGAGSEAAQKAIEGLGGANPDILFVFSSIRYDQQAVLEGAKEAAPSAIIAGGSAAGEITSGETAFDAVNAMAIASDAIRFSAGIGRGVSEDSFRAGAEAAKNVLEQNEGKTPDLFIMLPDGMTGNGAAIVEGVKSILGESAPVIGGSTGDDYRFEKTFEYYGGEAMSDAVVGIGLYGDFAYGFGIKHGWEPVGLPMKVTKAEGTLLQEIDGKPALRVYQEYFGADADELSSQPLARMAYTYPLGIAVEGSDELLIRDPVIANDKGEITMAAAIPEGAVVRLMIGDREKAIAAARDAAETAVRQLEGATPRLVLMFNCMARNKLLGIQCHEENQVVLGVIGKDLPMLGFYTYGEQGPLLGKKGTPAYFHNETMTLVVIGER